MGHDLDLLELGFFGHVKHILVCSWGPQLGEIVKWFNQISGSQSGVCGDKQSLRDLLEVQTKTRNRVILDSEDDQEWLIVNYLTHSDPILPSGDLSMSTDGAPAST